MEADRQVQARKTEIDAFKAQTDRIRMLHETAHMGGGTGPALAASAPVGVGG
jgi:hypothetical protein